MAYFILKFLHVIGAAVLLGTGAGIAFFMLQAHRSGDARVIAGTAKIVVLADFLFTATAVVAQPITGVLLAREAGYPLTEGWIVLSVALYIFTGLFWLPVVRMQMRMRTLAATAASRRRHPAGGISSLVPHLVRVRVPCLRRGSRDLLADDHPPGVVVGMMPAAVVPAKPLPPLLRLGSEAHVRQG